MTHRTPAAFNQDDVGGESPTAGRLEGLLSNVLRGGVLLSVATVLFGLVLILARSPGNITSIQARWAMPGEDYHFAHELKNAMIGVVCLDGRSIVTIGLLILIATPVVRVALSLLFFARQGDRVYVWLTSLVLLFLLISFLLGKDG